MSGQPELTAQETQQGRRGREERFNPIILRGYWSEGTGRVESLRPLLFVLTYLHGICLFCWYRNRVGRLGHIDRQACVCLVSLIAFPCKCVAVCRGEDSLHSVVTEYISAIALAPASETECARRQNLLSAASGGPSWLHDRVSVPRFPKVSFKLLLPTT